jgi:isocitrate lyase
MLSHAVLSSVVHSNLLRSPKKLLRRIRLQFGELHDGTQISESPFIFFIGFNRTATKALHEFFSNHGYPSIHMDGNRLGKRMIKNIQKGQRIFIGYESEYRVFSDLIIASEAEIVECNQFFKRMHMDYPEAMFILNTRPTQDWIRSRMKFRAGAFLRKQLKILASENEVDCEKLWEAQKEAHELEVRTYFEPHPHQFLELDISKGDVCFELSRFLGKSFDASKWQSVDF